jgi:penicillin amidase
MIFAAWARELTRAVFADELGGDEAYLAEVGRRDFRPALEGVLERTDERWCDDITTPVKETCADLVSRSPDRALTEIEVAQGPELAQWQWGRAHLARSEHRPFSKVKPLARWFEVRVPTGGESYTVNVARYHLRGDEPYLNEHAASLRAIYDLSDPAQSAFMHSSGQSGIVLSPHFRDFAPLWAAVQYVPAWSSGDRTLVLRGRENVH